MHGVLINSLLELKIIKNVNIYHFFSSSYKKYYVFKCKEDYNRQKYINANIMFCAKILC